MVSLELGKLAGKVGAAALLSLLNPLAALIPFVDPGSKGEASKADSDCVALARTSGAIPAAVKNPASTKVPPLAAAGTAFSPTR